jgi:superfamily II DNA or RNA helicase
MDREAPLLVSYNGSLRGVLRAVDDWGMTSYDLVAPPRRLSASESLTPLVEASVDFRRLEVVPSPASLLKSDPQEESWLGLTQRSLARLYGTFLIAEDPQRRLDARKAATLSHQASLVQHVLQNGNLRRILIADEVGLGKTLEAGFIIKRLTEDNRALRVLYLAPARLVSNVAYEFREKLDLDARTWVAGPSKDARIASDKIVIASIHKAVFGKNAEEVIESGPWDVLVVDECHHLSDWGEGSSKPNQSYKLVTQLAQSLRPDGRLILMSGTPHQGSATRFKNLLRLISDNGRLETAAGRVIYRTKDRVRDWRGRPLFPRRDVRPPTVVQLGDAYEAWYTSVGDLYDQSISNSARGRASGWAKGQALQWAASSVQAGLGFLARLAIRRLGWTPLNDALSASLAALRPYRGGSAAEPIAQLYERLRRQIGAHLQQENVLGDDEEAEEDEWLPDPDALAELLREGIALLQSPAASAKWEALSSIIDRAEDERIVFFAQPVETVSVVADFLERRYGRRPSIIVGNQSEQERRAQVDSFQADGGPRFLVSSRAGGEGLNMQRARRLVHLDVPWNPMELEQRIGRVHRFGSRKTIIVDTVVAAGSREVDMYRIAREKLRLIAQQIDPDQFETLFSRVMSLVAPEELEGVMDSMRAGPVPPAVSDEIGELVKKGYETWRTFDDEYKANAERIQSVSAGEAGWNDVRDFLRRYCGADDGPGTTLTSFTFVDEEIIDVDEQLPTVRLNGELFVCADAGGLAPDSVAGQKVRQLGLNMPELAAIIRRLFQTERVCGAGYLNRPTGIDHLGPSPFGVLSFLRQTIRYESDRAAEERLSLTSYIVRPTDTVELNPKQQADLLRRLVDSSRVQNPMKTELEDVLVKSERKLSVDLKRPSEADIAQRVRHMVWPVASLVIV